MIIKLRQAVELKTFVVDNTETYDKLYPFHKSVLGRFVELVDAIDELHHRTKAHPSLESLTSTIEVQVDEEAVYALNILFSMVNP